MCGFDQPAAQADDEVQAAEETQPQIQAFDGEGNEIELPEGFDLDALASLLFGGVGFPDLSDPATYVLVNTETGARAFEYTLAGVNNDEQPTISFELFEHDGVTAAAVKFDADEIAVAQKGLEEEPDPLYVAANVPSGALVFTVAQLRALAQVATETADAVEKANGPEADEITAGAELPDVPPVLIGGPDA